MPLNQKSKSFHWISSSKSPIRNHRPNTAPGMKIQTRKDVSNQDLSSDHDSEMDGPTFQISATKIPPIARVSKTNSPIETESRQFDSTTIKSSKSVLFSQSLVIPSPKPESILQENENSNVSLEKQPLGTEVSSTFSVGYKPSGSLLLDEELYPELQESNNEKNPETDNGEIVIDLAHEQKSPSTIDGDIVQEQKSSSNTDIGKNNLSVTIQEPIAEVKTAVIQKPKSNIKTKAQIELEKRPKWGARKSYPTHAERDFNNIKDQEIKKKPTGKYQSQYAQYRIYSRRKTTDSTSDTSDSEISDSNSGGFVVTPEIPTNKNTELKADAIDSNIIAPNPFQKLRASQYNLFSRTAGPFRGPGDAYYKFVLGGKSIRQGGKVLQKQKMAEVDFGKMDEILVDKKGPNRFATAAWNYRALGKLRDRQKELIGESIQKKMDTLEQTRAYIITTMASLRSHQELLKKLIEQNDKLKEEYKLVLKVINERVSQTLKKNEDFKHEIHQLETEKTRERKRLVKDFGKLMRTWEEEIECIVFINEAVSEYCGNLRQAYEEKTQDLEDLKEFERASFEDPEVSTKKIVKEIEVKDQHLKDMEVQITNYNVQFKEQKEEIESKEFEKGLEIIQNAMSRFGTYFNKVIVKESENNARLKNEIQRQNQIRKEIETDIQTELERNKQFKLRSAKMVDPRRKVLKLKEFMTCTPEMDIILSNRYINDTNNQPSSCEQFQPTVNKI